jgi:hypothetical protein
MVKDFTRSLCRTKDVMHRVSIQNINPEHESSVVVAKHKTYFEEGFTMISTFFSLSKVQMLFLSSFSHTASSTTQL